MPRFKGREIAPSGKHGVAGLFWSRSAITRWTEFYEDRRWSRILERAEDAKYARMEKINKRNSEQTIEASIRELHGLVCSLRVREWSVVAHEYGEKVLRCPACGGSQKKGHYSECSLRAMIGKWEAQIEVLEKQLKEEE